MNTIEQLIQEKAYSLGYKNAVLFRLKSCRGMGNVLKNAYGNYRLPDSFMTGREG